jgi:Flp pilus assembly protein TadD
MFAVLAGALISCASLCAADLRPPSSLHREETKDPFWLPPELIAFAKDKLRPASGDRAKAEVLLEIFMSPKNAGGLGIEYSNDRTRTINEVWTERKANCLSLTLTYVMLAKHLQINATFAESMAAANWSRVGDVILKEKHVVAIITWNPPNVLVADFLNQTGTRYGNYFVNKITNDRAKSLYYSNCAVEALIANDREGAIEKIEKALECDPTSSQAWNIKGVIEKSQNNLADAERYYKTAIRNNPNDVTAIGNLAALYRKEGFLEEAFRLRALEDRLRKMDPYYHAFLASEAFDNSDLKKARKSIKNAIKIHPEDPEFYITLSYIYLAQNKTDEAIDALLQAKSRVIPDRIANLDFMIQEYRKNSEIL